MTRLYVVPLLLTLACATMHPRPVPDQGSGGSVPHANYLLQSIEGQAMAPIGSPSWLGQAYSLTLNAPSGASGISIKSGAFLCMDGPACTKTMVYDGSRMTFTPSVQAPNIIVTSGTSAGTVTLVAGAGTAGTFSGARCVCSDTTAANAVKCSVASTTLSITGTGTDVIAYHCH